MSLTQYRTQQAVERRLVGEAELLAYDRLEHLVHRRTSPGGEPVLPLENEGGQFVPVIQLGRRVRRESGGSREQVLGDHS